MGICALALSSVNSLSAKAISAIPVEEYKSRVDAEQVRLDLMDGVEDRSVAFSTQAQNKRGQFIYFKLIDQIQSNLESAVFPKEEIDQFYSHLLITMEGLRSTNARYLAYFEQHFTMINRLSEMNGTQRDVEMLKNQVSMTLDCIPYFLLRPYAKDVLLFAAGKKPYDVLTRYKDFSSRVWFIEILEKVAREDPNAVKQFFGTSHLVNTVLKLSKDPVVLKLYEIFSEYGRASSGYTNIDAVFKGKLTIAESEALVENKSKWYAELCTMRQNPEILGSYSIDQELTYRSLVTVRKVNLLHDESDAVRFAILNKSTDIELYNLMVYSKDEIFTSSFLGMFNRMMQRRRDSSLYSFFEKQSFNKFRTFIQMCAGFNKLQDVLNTMSGVERDLLIDRVVGGLETTGGNLEPAVEVADIYGSISDSLLRVKIQDRLENELRRCFLYGNTYGARLYGLLLKLTGGVPENITGSAIAFNIPPLDMVEKELLLPDGKNVQQHIFYDDEDGLAAFNSFIGTFRNDPAYKISAIQAYTKIESIKGNKVILYCNNPKYEKGLDVLRKVFETSNRYPDIVVHRGHSYHLGTTVEQLTNNVKIAVLGSCGGYLNISRVLDNATDAQIVSSKQVGTWTVNNVLMKDIADMIRNGNGEINWEKLWLQLDKKLNKNDKWSDYIPPYRNLGVRFVKAFEEVN